MLSDDRTIQHDRIHTDQSTRLNVGPVDRIVADAGAFIDAGFAFVERGMTAPSWMFSRGPMVTGATSPRMTQLNQHDDCSPRETFRQWSHWVRANRSGGWTEQRHGIEYRLIRIHSISGFSHQRGRSKMRI